jgi:hypothetical protein
MVLHHFATIARVEVEVERASKRGSARTDLRGGARCKPRPYRNLTGGVTLTK